jgi:adenylosuccinate lyase
MSSDDLYSSPLITRYASRAMAELWSPRRRAILWRTLWVALADAERKLGLGVTEEQVAALRAAVDQVDLGRVAEHERRLRHDVMAHVHAFGEVAPSARAIIHLGATSAYVTDNADLILLRDALAMVRDQLVGAIDALAEFAARWKDLPCLGYTHFQPAQLVTVGKRASLWCYELVLDLAEIERRISELQLLGVKGTTGTQASFLALFHGDHAKVEALDRMVAEEFGFKRTYPVTGQTYSRKVDSQVLADLAGIGESAHRFGSDLRLLAHERELEEPFEPEQVGSSAMAYKRNPMRAERLCSLARVLLGLPAVARQTAATQWLERTLDDSAARRVMIPDAFLASDAILRLYLNIVPGLVVNPGVVAQHVERELPFIATENLMMAAVEGGADRQEVHAIVRKHSLEVAERLKHGKADRADSLIERLKAEPSFRSVRFETLLDPKRYIGRASEQVDAFIDQEIAPLRRRYPDLLGQRRQVDV